MQKSQQDFGQTRPKLGPIPQFLYEKAEKPGDEGAKIAFKPHFRLSMIAGLCAGVLVLLFLAPPRLLLKNDRTQPMYLSMQERKQLLTIVTHE